MLDREEGRKSLPLNKPYPSFLTTGSNLPVMVIEYRYTIHHHHRAFLPHVGCFVSSPNDQEEEK